MVLKTANARQIARKPKPALPDFWAFLEKIDAPQWVDLALEGTFVCGERDDSWFHSVHPFHQKSFHELVSASPLAVQTKCKVSKPVHLCPGLSNSVSKSRGKPKSRNKVAGLPINLPGVNNPHKFQNRLSGGKPTLSKPNGNANTGSTSSACLYKLSNSTTITARSQIPSKGIKLKSAIAEQVKSSTIGDPSCESTLDFLHIPRKGNELKKSIGVQVKSSAVGYCNCHSTQGCLQIPSDGNELKSSIDAQAKSSTVGDLNCQLNQVCLQIPSNGNESKYSIESQVKTPTVVDLNCHSTQGCLQINSSGNELENLTDSQLKTSTVGDFNCQSIQGCLQLNSKGNESEISTDAQVKSSTVGDFNCRANQGCLQIPSKVNESKSSTDMQVKSSTVGDINNQSTVTEIRAAMPRTTGLLSMLKMSSLRRSCGVLPMRVEVKDEQQQKVRKSSSSKISTGSLDGTNRKTSSIGSTNNNSLQVKKEDKVKLLKNQARSSTKSPIKNNRKKSSTGSSSTIIEKTEQGCEAAMTKNKAGRALKEVGRKQGQAIGDLGRNQGQPIRNTKRDVVLSQPTKTAARQPLQDVNNVGLSQRKIVTLQNQRFTEKENSHLGTIQHQKVNRVERKKPHATAKQTLCDQGELKVPVQPNAGNMVHPIKYIKQREKNSGCSYSGLSHLQREKANTDIQISKTRYR